MPHKAILFMMLLILAATFIQACECGSEHEIEIGYECNNGVTEIPVGEPFRVDIDINTGADWSSRFQEGWTWADSGEDCNCSFDPSADVTWSFYEADDGMQYFSDSVIVTCDQPGTTVIRVQQPPDEDAMLLQLEEAEEGPCSLTILGEGEEAATPPTPSTPPTGGELIEIRDQIPGDGDIGTNPMAGVSFALTSCESGIDRNSLNVTVNGEPAIVGGVFQPGYDSSSYLEDWGPQDLYVDIGRDGILTSQLVEVMVTASDMADNSGNWSYSFTTGDLLNDNPPTISTDDPRQDQTDVNPATNIKFNVYTDYYSPDGNTLNVTVNGEPAIVNGVLQAGYNGTDSSIIVQSDIWVTLDREDDLPLSDEVNVTVRVSDMAGISTTFSYSFTTSGSFDNTPPEISMEKPRDGETGVDPATYVLLQVEDELSAVDPNTLTVIINNVQMIGDGVFSPKYASGASGINNQGSILEATIDGVSDLPASESIEVIVRVSDTAGNMAWQDFHFETR